MPGNAPALSVLPSEVPFGAFLLMKTRLFSTASMLAAVAAASLLVANVSTAQGGDLYTCPGCEGKADPKSVEIPTPPGDPCDLIRFDFYATNGLCARPEPHPSAPCDQVNGCKFSVGLICVGDCSGYAAGLFSLGGAVIPVLMPCGTLLYLGEAPCGSQTPVTMAAVDLSTGAVAFASSNLICFPCDD